PGATNSTLTITNLQISDSGTYSLVASNASGLTSSSGSLFTVNQVPFPDANNIISSPANQTGRGTTYSPTWAIAPSSLLAGKSPSAIGGTGNFIVEGCGGTPVLTDGVFGSVGSAINGTLASCGGTSGAQNAGNSVTYTLTGSSSGYDLTNIVTYGGWSDGGRDSQSFTVSYSSIASPSTFVPLTVVSYNPTLPGTVPSTTRMLIASASGGSMATNVAAIKFDFLNPIGENGWEGYAELTAYGPASAPLPLPPTVTQDLLPHTGSDVVGSQVRFTTAFNGTAPITYQWFKGGSVIPGATNPTLVINNLQTTDSGNYSLQASNSLGVVSTTTNTFTVNNVPAPVNGVIVSPANQTDVSGGFVPTWTVASGSLIAGKAPSSVGTGTFTQEGAAGTSVLTDGSLGTSGGALTGFATCGSGGGGHSVTYTLTGSANGYNLSNVVVYAGWGDNGRDQQAYTVSYSKVATPTTFASIASVNYNPAIAGSTPSADRVTLSSSTAGFIASNVAAVKFDFTSPAGENGYSGYGEIQVFGVSATPPTPPTIGSTTVSGGNMILTGTGGTAGSGYTMLTSTNVATALASWTTNTTGTFGAGGSFSNSVPITPSEAKRFFLIRVP
ncbi:MAG: multidomain protein with s-layer y region, glug motif, ig motif, i-set domain, pkd domain, partial [Pedosphaera sp.]|nr:multidomain protein with s-layer y region, glug motif, ig motif, i-set domain, pkd domain [Pedosphaera sp.]